MPISPTEPARGFCAAEDSSAVGGTFRGTAKLALMNPDCRIIACAALIAVCVCAVLSVPLHCAAEDGVHMQRLPPVATPSDMVDWDREAAAMVDRHLSDNSPNYNLASMQPQQSSQMQRQSRGNERYPWNRARIGRPSQSGQSAAEEYTARIGEGPAWLGEMAPYMLTGDREGVGFHGLLEVDEIYDTNAVGLVPNKGVVREFVTSAIPVTGTPASTLYPREVISPNQTQLGVWFEQPTNLARFRAYTLMNLFKEVDRTAFQIYKVYANYGWFKAGKDYTVFFNQSAAPDTIDFEGPNAIPYVRTPQLVLNIPFESLGLGDHQGLVFGVEHMPGELTLRETPAPTSPPAPAQDEYVSVNQMPSIIAKYVYTPERAHIEAAGLFRRLTGSGPGYRSTSYGYGMALSGKIATWGKNNLILAAQGGQGIAAYSQDSSGLGLDAAPASFNTTGPGGPARGPLKSVPIWGSWVSYQHFWTDKLRSTGTFSVLTVNDQWVSDKLTPVNNIEDGADISFYGRLLQARYASINLVWSPNPTFTLGIEYMYGHRFITGNSIPTSEGATSNKGQANRLQACVRWNFDHKTNFRK